MDRPEERQAGSVLVARPLWPLLRRIVPLLSAEGWRVEEVSSWVRLLEAGFPGPSLAGIFLGEYGDAGEETALLEKFRGREGAAGIPIVLVGGMNAVLRISRFRAAGVDLVVPADTTPQELMEKSAPLLHYGSLYQRLRRRNHALREKAMIDELTGLPDRRHFSLDAARQVEMARRTGRPLSCVIADIDDFRKVNDAYGNPAGDAVIRQFGELLSGVKRTYDCVARLGGDEFAWLLVDANRVQALSAAERAHGIVRERTFDFPGASLRLTATWGVSSVSAGEELTVDFLVGNADRALYWGKESGKNVVRFYPAKKAEESASNDSYVS